MRRPIVSCIIPVRKEEDTILVTLRALSHMQIPHETIVVSDRIAQDDRTEAVVRAYIQKHTKERVRLLVRTQNRAPGFPHALSWGVAAARAPYVVFIMADGCDRLSDIPKMVEKAEEGDYAVVTGSRYMQGGGKSGGPAFQGGMSTLVNRFVYALHITQTTDASNAFKCIRKKVWQHIMPRHASGVESSLEVAIRASLLRLRMGDVPTHWQGRDTGESKFVIRSRLPKYAYIIMWGIYKALQKSIWG